MEIFDNLQCNQQGSWQFWQWQQQTKGALSSSQEATSNVLDSTHPTTVDAAPTRGNSSTQFYRILLQPPVWKCNVNQSTSTTRSMDSAKVISSPDKKKQRTPPSKPMPPRNCHCPITPSPTSGGYRAQYTLPCTPDRKLPWPFSYRQTNHHLRRYLLYLTNFHKIMPDTLDLAQAENSAPTKTLTWTPPMAITYTTSRDPQHFGFSSKMSRDLHTVQQAKTSTTISCVYPS